MHPIDEKEQLFVQRLINKSPSLNWEVDRYGNYECDIDKYFVSIRQTEIKDSYVLNIGWHGKIKTCIIHTGLQPLLKQLYALIKDKLLADQKSRSIDNLIDILNS